MSGHEIDPTQPPSVELSRRVFVGGSVAATTAVSTPAALAQQPALGQMHPPLVPENDPAISVERVLLKRPDVMVPAYAAWPAASSSNTSSVVVIMHVWGVDTSIRDVVRRLAKTGFGAIAPNLYARCDAPNGDGATDSKPFRACAARLDRTQYDGDIRSAQQWLVGKFPRIKVGIMGFCMGGRIVLQQAVDNADVFAAACPFYGALDDVDPASVRVPLCGSYGARDTSIPAAGVRAFWSALKVPNQLKIYDNAGHAFFDDQRPSYVASAAEDAWTRTIDFFNVYLRQSSS